MKYKDRKQFRLKRFDYSQTGYYFVTICARNKLCYFGDIVDGKMNLSKIGKIAAGCWMNIPRHCNVVMLDNWVVMPNHIHGIIVLCNDDENNGRNENDRHGRNAPWRVPTKISTNDNRNGDGNGENGRNTPWRVPAGIQSLNKKSLSSIINHYKGAVTRECNTRNLYFKWQSRFFDHIIRNQYSLNKIRNYIEINSAKWEFDQLYLKDRQER